MPIIVAVNKIDKARRQPRPGEDRSWPSAASCPEEWGGDTVFVNVSALQRRGHRRPAGDDPARGRAASIRRPIPTAPPFGVVIESKVDIGIGVVATVLVKQGTLRKGQFILVRHAMSAGSSAWRTTAARRSPAPGLRAPARIIGFSDPPENGDKVYCFMNKKQAQAIADQRQAEARMRARPAGATGRMSLEKFFSAAQQAEIKDLNLIVKADVGGTEEALGRRAEAHRSRWRALQGRQQRRGADQRDRRQPRRCQRRGDHRLHRRHLADGANGWPSASMSTSGCTTLSTR